jgi:hypothetical protein
MRKPMDLQSVCRTGLLGLLVLGVFVLPSRANSLNLLMNGDFENPLVPPASMCGPFANCLGFHNGVAGRDDIAGWLLVGKGGVDSGGFPIPGAPATVLLLGKDYNEPDDATQGTLHFHPQHGLQSLDLTGEGNQGTTNGIKQSVATLAGKNYVLTFWVGHQYSLAPGYRNGPGAVGLYLDGQSVGSFANSRDTFEDVTWMPFQYAFTASGPHTVITFLNDTPVGNNYAGLDNVSLVAVPEPASLVLIVLGLGCVAFLSLRPRRTSHFLR